MMSESRLRASHVADERRHFGGFDGELPPLGKFGEMPKNVEADIYEMVTRMRRAGSISVIQHLLDKYTPNSLLVIGARYNSFPLCCHAVLSGAKTFYSALAALPVVHDKGIPFMIKYEIDMAKKKYKVPNYGRGPYIGAVLSQC